MSPAAVADGDGVADGDAGVVAWASGVGDGDARPASVAGVGIASGLPCGDGSAAAPAAAAS